MKNMMKKTLSVIIALAMILVPMSVFAATGDPVAMPDIYIYSGEIVTVEAGATTFFEIGFGSGTVDFIVEGNGDFTVAVCTEGDGTTPYAEGTPVASTNGVVETEITLYESTNGWCAFAITNNSTESVDYTCTLNFPEGTESNPKALTIPLDSSEQVTVPAYGQYYIALTLPQMYTEYQLTITGNTGFGYSGGMGMPNWDTNGTYTGTVAAFWGMSPVANFSIVNNTPSEQTYTLSLADVPKPLGSEYNPDALPMDTTVDKYVDGVEYWYTWTATEAGVLKIEMNNALCADGWTYKFECGDDIRFFSTGWDESHKNVCEAEVEAGDVVMFAVSVPTYYEGIGSDPYVLATGSVIFTTSFTADATIEGGEGDQGGEDIGGGDDTAITGDNYIVSNDVLEVGTKDYAVSPMYQYTLFMFEPTETGKYTITTTDSLIGYLGGGLFYYADPSAENVASTTYEWECTSVGQGILIGVMANSNTANITITKEALDESDELQWTIYENTVAPEAFEYEGDASALEPVDFEDDVIDNAVLGEDGYYHLNSADGPILYANLNETGLQSLVSIIGNGKLSAVHYDDGVVIEKIDYTEAVTEYINCAYVDDATGAYYYPLTADLIEMFKEVGASNEWYDGEIWVHDSADAWMFACYYAPVTADNGGENAGDNNTGNVADPEIPNTDSKAFGVAIAMMATVAALGATVVTTKKSKRVK